MIDDAPSKTTLAEKLRSGLSGFRSEGFSGTEPHARGLFSYCVQSRERLVSVQLQWPIIGFVLSGAKEVWRGEIAERIVAGTLFVLPAQVDMDIVNEPDEKAGLYQSLVLEVDPDAIPDIEPLAGARRPSDQSCIIPLTSELVDTVIHATRTIAQGDVGAVVRRARLSELLALLEDIPQARPLFDMSVCERVARLVCSGLDDDWTAARIAERLAMSESTLRRRLVAEGHSFSGILRRERMQAAQRLIIQGASSGSTALAVGYASRAHFARAYRSMFGGNPKRD